MLHCCRVAEAIETRLSCHEDLLTREAEASLRQSQQEVTRAREAIDEEISKKLRSELFERRDRETRERFG